MPAGKDRLRNPPKSRNRPLDPSGRSLKEIRELLATLTGQESRGLLLTALEKDPRKGARQLADRARRSESRVRRRDSRWQAFCDPERQLQEKGFNLIAGVDEAGRGPLAGPVVAAAVILPEEFTHHPLDDSKRMTASSREKAYDEITAKAVAWSVAAATPREIDRNNILGAVHLAVNRALEELEPAADFALIDGRPLASCPVPHQAIVKGDQRCRAIAAASVLAKVTRDRMMVDLDRKYPGYGFADHKGYGTPEHLKALKKLGSSPVHRRSFGRKNGQLDLLEEAGMLPDTHAWGLEAERLVSADYESRGYRVLHRRWRGGGGELDLVCCKDDQLAVVEIKAARGTGAGAPLEWLTSAQRRRWRRAAAALVRSDRDLAGLELRFDLVGVQARSDAEPAITRFEAVEP